jgi:hypothetical protein
MSAKFVIVEWPSGDRIGPKIVGFQPLCIAATLCEHGVNDAQTDNFQRNVLHGQDIALRSF